MMQRMACFEKIAEARDGAIVVATYTSAFEWHRVDPNPLNFVSVGAMGQASSHALGLAIGLPDQKIIVLDGDGSLLMNLSTLTTIANAAPKNLIHFVIENGTYEANGGHPTPAQGKAKCAPSRSQACATTAGPSSATWKQSSILRFRMGSTGMTSGASFWTGYSVWLRNKGDG